MAVRAGAAALALFALAVRKVGAEIFRLKEEPVPGNWTLSTLYFFYIYNHADAPDARNEAFVRFSDLAFVSTSPRRTEKWVQEYISLQLSVVKWEHFWDVINPKDFCCTEKDVETQRCDTVNRIRFRRTAKREGVADDVDVYDYAIKPKNLPTDITRDSKRVIRATGVYVLLISNC